MRSISVDAGFIIALESVTDQNHEKAHREARFWGDPAERLLRRVVFCASSINDRRAAFTASSFGNA
jgi:hypothetical protein